VAETGRMDLAVLLARTLRVAWRTFAGVIKLFWRVCDLPVRLLVPARYPAVRAALTAVVFVLVVVALDVALTGARPTRR
jgi:hypothetical protein